MYKVTVWDEFSSAHFLKGYKGKCENLHGHNWRVSVTAEKEELDKAGMVIDFKDLKKILNEALKALDHKCLNEVDYFKEVNPTSENITEYIYNYLESQIEPDVCRIIEVSVWETDKSRATFTKE